MWVVCLQIHQRAGDIMNEKFEFRVHFITSKWVYLKINYELKVTHPFNMQSEFTALQGAPYTT